MFLVSCSSAHCLQSASLMRDKCCQLPFILIWNKLAVISFKVKVFTACCLFSVQSNLHDQRPFTKLSLSLETSLFSFLTKLESFHSPPHTNTEKDKHSSCSPLPQFIYLFTSSAQSGEESPESVDTLQLDDKQQNDENNALQGEGHEEASHARLRHREVVCLVCDV